MVSFGGVGINPLQKAKIPKAGAFDSPKANIGLISGSDSSNDSGDFVDPGKSAIFSQIKAGEFKPPTLSKSISSMPAKENAKQ